MTLTLLLMAGGNLAAGLLDQPAGEVNFVGEGGTGFFNVCVAAGAIALTILAIAAVLLLHPRLHQGRAGRRRPVGGPHARVGDHVTAAARQLHGSAATDRDRSPAARRPRSCGELAKEA